VKKTQQLQSDYSRNGRYIQLALPINTEYFIPVDDSVRLIDQVLEEIDYRELQIPLKLHTHSVNSGMTFPYRTA